MINSRKSAQLRNSSVVVLRVLGMMLIILCHIIAYYTFVPGSDLLSQVFNVGVQVFLLISGYLYGEKQSRALAVGSFPGGRRSVSLSFCFP